MKSILVPIDFSENAEKALEYALHFAVHFNSEIILFHSWDLPHQKSSLFVSMQENIRKRAEEETKALKEKVKDRFPNLKIKVALMMGEAADAIKSAAKNLSVDYIIMGTKGATGLTKYFLGSVTSEVIEDAPCPVFAVPENAEFRNIRTIGYATDFYENDIKSINNLLNLVKLFNSKLIIIHIEKGKEKEKESFEAFSIKIKNECNYQSIETVLIEKDNVAESLNRIEKEYNLDLLALARKKRSFIENIFHKSITKEMTFSTSIPIIVFQDEQEPE